MARFSERIGIRPVREAFQIDSMDEDLRVSLWNAIGGHFFRSFSDHSVIPQDKNANKLLAHLWVNFFKWPLDERPDDWPSVNLLLKNFIMVAPWFEVYDFIEFVVDAYPQKATSFLYIEDCNRILKREMSAYRFVGFQLVRMTSEQEVAAIEDALKVAGPIQPVRDHLQRALSLLSDRKDPDYRNSIKESISAVEALCKLIAGDPKATLTSALNAIQKSGKVELHASLKESLAKLYGYTSDADGIRHALRDVSTVDYEDAMIMLTTCSAFVSYLLAKAQKAEIML